MVVKSRNTRLSIAELKRRRYFCLPVRMGNKRVLLASTRDIFTETKRIRLVLETEIKVPPYKQMMQMQMGRAPQQTQTEQMSYVLDVIQDMNENEYCEVFEVIR